MPPNSRGWGGLGGGSIGGTSLGGDTHPPIPASLGVADIVLDDCVVVAEGTNANVRTTTVSAFVLNWAYMAPENRLGWIPRSEGGCKAIIRR